MDSELEKKTMIFSVYLRIFIQYHNKASSIKTLYTLPLLSTYLLQQLYCASLVHTSNRSMSLQKILLYAKIYLYSANTN